MAENNEIHRSNQTFHWLHRFCNEHINNKELNIDELFENNGALNAWESAESILQVDANTLTSMVAKHFELDIADSPQNITEELLHFVPLKVAKEYGIFPLSLTDGQLIVASPHPFDSDMESMVEFLTSLHVSSQLAHPSVIAKWTELFYEDDALSQNDLVIKSNQANTSSSVAESISANSAIVKIVSEMLLEAFILKASDIHIEPFQGGGVVRYRIDGMLRVISELPSQVFIPIIQRIKAISHLNLAKKMVPQDGSVSLELKGQDVDLRVSTLPVRGGEKVVIRLLIKSAVNQIDEIGLQDKELKTFKNLLHSSEGIFIITGPTGSGKTSTLYSALKEINAPEKCLVTVEDPVEYEIEGIAQVNINPSQNLTFSSALRSILRQDPDVILMGEVRDEETAEITFRAAITGHFVMTTLHTSDAITTIPRLIGLGVSRPILADSLKGVAAQRLVRKLCSCCCKESTEDEYGKRLKSIFPKLNIMTPVGCDKCNQTGYKGRMPLFEIITMDQNLADAVRAGESSSALREMASKNGARSLYQVAIEAISKGHTSAEEINRVLGESFWKACSEKP
ncbi:GspE/PulE family protein [Pseudoalteromonas sp. MMG024]|uniref:GspE/PulE family protein n=1 Tax=Pseudoalteromonas sp. MMG024 TaxID=2909980 RepID=UPI001F1E3DFF|nr:GspE/PulE family protein [Pseudoalteromonas sp. MMG024]MCF6458902.1 GspE/PulE family protein [Pseudoalteromonas sp. MMG024]